LKETRHQLEEANKQHASMVEAMKLQAEELAKSENENGDSIDSPSKSDRLMSKIESLQN